MPTPSEQKALAFIAIVILLGGAVRVVRAGDAPLATPLEQQALARQATLADSAATASSMTRNKSAKIRRVSRSRRDTIAKIVAGISTVPPVYARPNDPFSHTPYGRQPLNRLGFPPPGPRIDIGPVVQRAITGSSRSAPPRPRPARELPVIDIDVAPIEQIDLLPRVGPSLARRLVANRDSFGPFRSLDGLRRVKGVGPATVERLAPLVSFSGRAAPMVTAPD